MELGRLRFRVADLSFAWKACICGLSEVTYITLKVDFSMDRAN